MGVLAVDPLRVRQLHVPQSLQGPLPPLLRRQVRVDPQALLHLLTDPHGGVHGAHRLLKHHTDILALNGTDALAAGVEQILAVQQDAAPEVRLLRPQQTGYHHGRYGLAGAGFAHQSHNFTVLHRQVDAPYRLVVGGMELHMKVLDLQHGATSPISSAAGPRR